jgi:hypothetical protein
MTLAQPVARGIVILVTHVMTHGLSLPDCLGSAGEGEGGLISSSCRAGGGGACIMCDQDLCLSRGCVWGGVKISYCI